MMRTVYIFDSRNFDRKLRASLQKILTLNSEKVRVYKKFEIRNSDETEFLSSQPVMTASHIPPKRVAQRREGVRKQLIIVFPRT